MKYQMHQDIHRRISSFHRKLKMTQFHYTMLTDTYHTEQTLTQRNSLYNLPYIFRISNMLKRTFFRSHINPGHKHHFTDIRDVLNDQLSNDPGSSNQGRVPRSSLVYRHDPLLLNDILRVARLLSKMSLPGDMKFPILLPTKVPSGT